MSFVPIGRAGVLHRRRLAGLTSLATESASWPAAAASSMVVSVGTDSTTTHDPPTGRIRSPGWTSVVKAVPVPDTVDDAASKLKSPVSELSSERSVILVAGVPV